MSISPPWTLARVDVKPIDIRIASRFTGLDHGGETGPDAAFPPVAPGREHNPGVVTFPKFSPVVG